MKRKLLHFFNKKIINFSETSIKMQRKIITTMTTKVQNHPENLRTPINAALN